MTTDRKAFSLIEVVIVLLVIGLLSAVSAPRFASALTAARLEVAARQLASHIDYARRVAVNEGRSVSITFDHHVHSYGCDSVDFPDRVGVPLQVTLPTEYDPSITLLANFDSASTLTFDFEGVPHVNTTPLTDGSILLSSHGQQFRVVVASGTGTTEVQRQHGSDGGAIDAMEPGDTSL